MNQFHIHLNSTYLWQTSRKTLIQMCMYLVCMSKFKVFFLKKAELNARTVLIVSGIRLVTDVVFISIVPKCLRWRHDSI